MRGNCEDQSDLFSYMTLEERVPGVMRCGRCGS